MIIIRNFLFNFITFCAIVSFLTKLLTLGILPAVRALVVAKLFILALRVVLVAS